VFGSGTNWPNQADPTRDGIHVVNADGSGLRN
jgi:hypothetical protein